MPRYSPERKEAVLKKLLPPYNRTAAEVAREEGLSLQTLYNWRNQEKQSGQPVPGKTHSSENWSSEAKLAVVIETSRLSAAELSQYCREKGLYPEQVQRWKAESLQGFVNSKAQQQALQKQTREDKASIKALKKELRRKDKALAETTALLVLRKKLRAFYGEEPEDD